MHWWDYSSAHITRTSYTVGRVVAVEDCIGHSPLTSTRPSLRHLVTRLSSPMLGLLRIPSAVVSAHIWMRVSRHPSPGLGVPWRYYQKPWCTPVRYFASVIRVACPWLHSCHRGVHISREIISRIQGRSWGHYLLLQGDPSSVPHCL